MPVDDVQYLKLCESILKVTGDHLKSNSGVHEPAELLDDIINAMSYTLGTYFAIMSLDDREECVERVAKHILRVAKHKGGSLGFAEASMMEGKS